MNADVSLERRTSITNVAQLTPLPKHSKGISKHPRRRTCAKSCSASLILKSDPVTNVDDNISLQVSFSKVNSFKWHSVQWRGSAIVVSLIRRLSDLPGLLKPLVLLRVAKDAYLRRRLDNRQHTIELSIAITLPSEQRYEVISLDERPRVDLLSDLFLEPKRLKLTLDVEVKLKLCRVKQVATGLEDQIILPEYGGSETTHRVIRIGYVPVVDSFRSEVQERRHGGHPDGVAYVQPLLAWVDRQTHAVHFSRAHAYDFDEFCIGDPEEWTPWNRVSFSNRHYFLGSLEQVQKKGESKGQFVERLKHVMADDDDQQMGSGVPFRPTYCYNVYRPEELGMGLSCFPKQGIDVAVTVINRIDACRELKHVAFPRDIRIVVDEQDGPEDIVELIRTLINRRGGQDGAVFDSDKLFECEHRGQWELQLGVMPQTGPRKLYRYTEGKLDRFLSPALTVRTRDKRLYLEAHAVPSS